MVKKGLNGLGETSELSAITREQYLANGAPEVVGPKSLREEHMALSREERSEMPQQRWQDEAACQGDVRSYFFPPTDHNERKDDKLERESRAKMICGGCAVKSQCLEYALAAREPHGIWGGTNEVERKALLSKTG